MRIKVSDQLSIRKIENEIFILNRKDSLLHSFNGTGALLWETLQTAESSEALVEILTEKYEIDRAAAENDIMEFLNELSSVHLIERV
jgi:hypothetical protein